MGKFTNIQWIQNGERENADTMNRPLKEVCAVLEQSFFNEDGSLSIKDAHLSYSYSLDKKGTDLKDWDLVYVDNNGVFQKAIDDGSNKDDVVGAIRVFDAGSPTEKIELLTAGIIKKADGNFTPGQVYFLSSNTPGAVSVSGKIQVGLAISSTEILIKFGTPKAAGGGGANIEDNIVSSTTTWSSQKIKNEVSVSKTVALGNISSFTRRANFEYLNKEAATIYVSATVKTKTNVTEDTHVGDIVLYYDSKSTEVSRISCISSKGDGTSVVSVPVTGILLEPSKKLIVEAEPVSGKEDTFWTIVSIVTNAASINGATEDLNKSASEKLGDLGTQMTTEKDSASDQQFKAKLTEAIAKNTEMKGHVDSDSNDEAITAGEELLVLLNAAKGLAPSDKTALVTGWIATVQEILNELKSYKPTPGPEKPPVNPDVPSIPTDPDAKFTQAGVKGFGVAYMPVAAQSVGLTPLDGANDPNNDNFGNFKDQYNNIFVCIPKMYYKVDTVNRFALTGNTPSVYISLVEKDGYIPFYAFRKTDGSYVDCVFVSKYIMSKESNRAAYKKNTDPVSSYSSYNIMPGGGTTNEGYFTAVKTTGSKYCLHYAAMRFVYYLTAEAHKQELLRKYGSRNSVPAELCAWLDTGPMFPKGNDTSLKSGDDSTLTFTQAGSGAYTGNSKCGSCSNFAKSSHNGQACGIIDLVGQMYEVDAGYECIGTNYTDLYVLKGIDQLASLTASNHKNTSYYTKLNVTGRATSSGRWGNGTNPVLSFKNTLNDQMADSVLLALSNGISSSGTDDYGTDSFYPLGSGYCPLFGGYWRDGASSGLLYFGGNNYSWSGYRDAYGARAMLVP